jgi:c-di-AMP phosphodiesterase-like protein
LKKNSHFTKLKEDGYAMYPSRDENGLPTQEPAFWKDLEKKEEANEFISVMTKIIEIVEIDNYDNSRIEEDYIDVGFYTHYNIGKWDKPFKPLK